MKGRVFDVQRFSVHDGPGIRTTVFLAGCPLRCAWCHNPEAFAGEGARLRDVEDVLAEALRDRDYCAASGGGVTVSGGEPLLQAGFVRELLKRARAERLHTCVQTSGAVPEELVRSVEEEVDLFQFDLKHLDGQRHEALTGVGNERLVENARGLAARGACVEFRLPVVPGFTDDDANLRALAAFLTGLGVRALQLVPYQRMYLDKYRALGLAARCAHVEPPSAAHLERVRRTLAGAGVDAAVAG